MLRSSLASQTQYFQNGIDCCILGTPRFGSTFILSQKVNYSTNDPNIPLNFSSRHSLDLLWLSSLLAIHVERTGTAVSFHEKGSVCTELVFLPQK